MNIITYKTKLGTKTYTPGRIYTIHEGENKMIIYRPHRGSLSDAMKEAQVFNSEEEMKKHILESWKNCGIPQPFELEDIEIDDDICNDERIGWKDSRYVIANNFRGEGRCVLGTCAYDFPCNG